MSERIATFLPRADVGRVSGLAEKRARLDEILRSLGRVLVAYSGGVDSSTLLAEAHRLLGHGVCGVIAKSPSLAEAELQGALSLAAEHGIAVRVIQTQEMRRSAYRANGPDRCYHCKVELFEQLERLAGSEAWDALAYGAVTDDLGDVRPGMAAAERLRIRAPLLEAGFSKIEARLLARRLGLKVWDKPQSACLASRIPHGSVVTEGKLRQVELGEAALRERFGLRVLRLRHEGRRARIEADPAELGRLQEPAIKEAILAILGRLGFSEIEIDPRGYRRADPVPGKDQED